MQRQRPLETSGSRHKNLNETLVDYSIGRKIRVITTPMTMKWAALPWVKSRCRFFAVCTPKNDAATLHTVAHKLLLAGDFGGGSGQKYLFRDIEFIAGDESFFQADSEMVTNFDHGVSRDSIQVGAGQGRGV